MHYNMLEPQDHFIKCNKIITEGQVLSMFHLYEVFKEEKQRNKVQKVLVRLWEADWRVSV